jgi:hypothetical protein
MRCFARCVVPNTCSNANSDRGNTANRNQPGSSKAVIILIILVLLLFAGGGGYYGYGHYGMLGGISPVGLIIVCAVVYFLFYRNNPRI